MREPRARRDLARGAEDDHERPAVGEPGASHAPHGAHGPYDLVFSNFGGLNCIPDLTAMTRGLPRLLKPGGFVTLVVMPPICLWALGQALRGDVKTAFRRLHRGGVMGDFFLLTVQSVR